MLNTPLRKANARPSPVMKSGIALKQKPLANSVLIFSAIPEALPL
jgi:hypothetical protein